ncbi:MAG: aminotransferase class V-fold PLP-dependent enzyme [Gammaproteobacteria bacterium]
MAAHSLNEYRNLFPIFAQQPGIAYLANCSAAPLAEPVRHAVNEYLDSRNRNAPDWETWMDVATRSKAAFARLIGAAADEIAIFSSLSDALSSIAGCLIEHKPAHVVTTASEFPTVGHVWSAHQQHGNCSVTFVRPARPDGVFNVAEIKAAVRSNTRVICVHHVAYYNGAKQDLAAIAALTHSVGAQFVVDAYQSMGTCRLDVKKLGIDVLISGNLKYLLGLPGTAYMYVEKSLANRLQPTVTGWFGRANPFNFDATQFDYADGTARFNTGTPPVIAAYGSLAGMELIERVGLAAIEKRIDELSEFTLRKAKQYGLKIASPITVHEKGANTAIHVQDADTLGAELRKDKIIVSPRKDVIRLAPHFFTTEAELDGALSAIHKHVNR